CPMSLDKPEIVHLVTIAKASHSKTATIRSDDDRRIVGKSRICGYASHASDIWPVHENAPKIEAHGTLAAHVQHVRVGAAPLHHPCIDRLCPGTSSVKGAAIAIGSQLSRINRLRLVADNLKSRSSIGNAVHLTVVDDDPVSPDPNQGTREYSLH